MRKNKKITWLTTLLIAGVLSFTACEKDEDPIVENIAVKEVKASINATGNGSGGNGSQGGESGVGN